MSFLLWILGSLIAISLIGDNPYIALALTALAGIAFGLNVHLDFASCLPEERRVSRGDVECHSEERSGSRDDVECHSEERRVSRDDREMLRPAQHDRPTPTRPYSDTRVRSFIARYGWLVDVAATALLVFPTRWMVVGFFLVLVSWSARAWAHQRIIRRTIFDLPILALLFMVPVSLWASADLATSLVPLGQIVAGLNAFYALVERVETEADLKWTTAGMIALGVLIALVAPFGVGWNQNKLFALAQVYNLFASVLPKAINPNQLAGALVLILPFATAMLLYAPLRTLSPEDGTRRLQQKALSADERRQILNIRVPPRSSASQLCRAGLVGACGGMAFILLLTQSRGGIAAAVVGLLILIAFKGRWVIGPALATLAGFIVFVWSRFDVSQVVDLFFSTDAISGLAGRQEVWSRAVYALQDVPYTGIGLGIFARALQVLYPLFLVGPDADVPHAHNLYLQVGVDLGIPGLVAYLAIMTVALVTAWQVFHAAWRKKTMDRAAIALGLCVALIAVLLHGFVDVVAWDSKPAILVWALLGMIAAIYRTERGNGELSKTCER